MQYHIQGKLYDTDTSVLLATSESKYPLPYLQVFSNDPTPEVKTHEYLYCNLEGEYFLIDDGSTPSILVLPVNGAKNVYKRLSQKIVKENEAFPT